MYLYLDGDNMTKCKYRNDFYHGFAKIWKWKERQFIDDNFL